MTRSRRTKISPESGRGLGHVTHTTFGSTVGYPSDSLASCFSIRSNISLKLLELETSNLIHGFVWSVPSSFPESGRGLGHVTPTIFDSTVGYPSDSLASCQATKSSCNSLSSIFGSTKNSSKQPSFELAVKTISDLKKLAELRSKPFSSDFMLLDVAPLRGTLRTGS